MNEFTVKDSGQRQEYASGMVRDLQDGKIDYLLALDGPMFERYAEHLTKGAEKYGKRNWQLAKSDEEYQRFRSSALRHMVQWLAGDTDEDHAAAVMFNINAAEYVKERIAKPEAPDLTRPVPIAVGTKVQVRASWSYLDGKVGTVEEIVTGKAAFNRPYNVRFENGERHALKLSELRPT